jgi:AcrR family transcriptional regulator
MGDETGGRRRRSTALSPRVIHEEAVRILDEGGRDALTLRALAGRLATGPGAIYHHVGNREELLNQIAFDLVGSALQGRVSREPGQAVHDLMLRMFDMVDEHSWVGAQLVAAPWQPAVLVVLDRLGFELDLERVSESRQFQAASTLVQYLLGIAGQHAAVQSLHAESGRAQFLAAACSRAVDGSEDGLPMVERMSHRIEHHDDRQQFANGVEIIMAGIRATESRPESGS